MQLLQSAPGAEGCPLVALPTPATHALDEEVPAGLGGVHQALRLDLVADLKQGGRAGVGRRARRNTVSRRRASTGHAHGLAELANCQESAAPRACLTAALQHKCDTHAPRCRNCHGPRGRTGPG